MTRAISRFFKRKNQALCPAGGFGFRADCGCGHSFVMLKSCKKEYCPVCGRPGSALHREKIQRWLPKILWLLKSYGSIGYMVITLPKEFWKKDRVFLKEFRRYVIRKLKRMGYGIGKCRYHFAGDKSGVYSPHLNILMAAAWIPANRLKQLKSDIAAWLGYAGPQVVIEYKYSMNLPKVLHWVKYVCRPTLMLIKDDQERISVWWAVMSHFVNDVEWRNTKKAIPKAVLHDTVDFDGIKQQLTVDDYKLFCLFVGSCPYCRQKLKWRYIRERDSPFKDVVFVNFLGADYAELVK